MDVASITTKTSILHHTKRVSKSGTSGILLFTSYKIIIIRTTKMYFKITDSYRKLCIFLSLSNWKYLPPHCCHIVPWLCLRYVYLHILSVVSYRSQESWGFISITTKQSMMCVNGANMGSTWVLSAPDGPHVGPMNLAIVDRLHHGPKIVFVCLHITLSHWHHYAELSGSIVHTKYLSGVFCWVCV